MNAARVFIHALCLLPAIAQSQAIPVHHLDGRLRGFVVLRDQSGRQIGNAELNQVAVGDTVHYHMVYRFRDGSVDEETATYTQHDTFQLVADHHLQTGPFFSKPLDLSVDASGKTTERIPGKPQPDITHLDLEPGTAVTGMISSILANIDPKAAAFKLPVVSPTRKPRFFHLDISAAGKGTVRIAGTQRSAAIFRLHTDLGGLAGIVAPIIGKEPADIVVWVLQGEAPMVIRMIGQLAEGGSIVDAQLAGTTFPRSPTH